MIEILTDNHYKTIVKLFDGVKREIKIVSPFLSEGMADRLCETVSAKGVRCTFITRFYVQDLFEGANSIAGLEKMLQTGIKVYAAVGLHTKLYLFDGVQAVMGSANFTASGLKTNIELSLLFSEEAAVVQDLDRAFCGLLQRILAAGGGEVTSQMLDEARKLTLRVWKGNKTGQLITKNSKMYGAVLDKKAFNWEEELDRCRGEGESDVVYRAFREAQARSEIRYDHTIWLKFDGDARNRIGRDERFPLVSVLLDGKRVYVQNYPWKPSGVKDGDEVYLAAITTDSAGKISPLSPDEARSGASGHQTALTRHGLSTRTWRGWKSTHGSVLWILLKFSTPALKTGSNWTRSIWNWDQILTSPPSDGRRIFHRWPKSTIKRPTFA